MLITRSQPGADRLAVALAGAAMDTLVVPLVEVTFTLDAAGKTTLANLDRFDRVIFVSAHAAASAMPEIDRCWPQLPSLEWFAVGRATARALSEWGVSAVCPEAESSEGILALPALASVAGARVLLICGRGGRTLIEERLRARGAEVVRLEVYERGPRPVERGTLESEQPDVVIVSSGEVGQRLLDVWPGAAKCAIVVPSVRIAEALEQRGCRDVWISDGASAEAVIKTLEQIKLDK